MDFLQSLSDDQLALLGCFAALAGAGLLMSVSFYLGQWTKPSKAAIHQIPPADREQNRSNKAA